MEVDALLRTLVEVNGSDLHLCAGEPPAMRVHKLIRRTRLAELTAAEISATLQRIAGPERWQRFGQDLELDFAYVVPGAGRFRVNIYQEQEGPAGCFHHIPSRVRTIDELALPPVLKEIAGLPRGVVLVTGPTGSGKSTTLAAIIDHINKSRPIHVVTIEDPIEFIHAPAMASITQREITVDTHSFAEALRHVMRQNPDVILVGEMRDLETIQLAITAGETGHLVFSTLHTLDAVQTVDRIVDIFDSERQEQVRAQLAITVQAVISQELLPCADGQGLVAVFEVMIATPGIRSLIRERKTHQIYTLMQGGGDVGMQTFDQHLRQLLAEGRIAPEEALAKARDPQEFAHRAQADLKKQEAE